VSGCVTPQEELQVPSQEENTTQPIVTNNASQESNTSNEDVVSPPIEQENPLTPQESQEPVIQQEQIVQEAALQEAKKVQEQEEQTRAKIAKEMKKNVYLDKVQKLMWQDNAAATEVQKPWVSAQNYERQEYNHTSGDTASMYCKKLTLVGYSDWRLPTKEELKSLYTQTNALKNVGANWYWSSTSSQSAPERAWGVYFNNGDGYSDLKSTNNYVRCVRASKYLK
jgi:hypothetical protein